MKKVIIALLLMTLFVGISLIIDERKLNIAVKGVATEELPFVVVIPSYNNAAYVAKNLESIFSQEYNNYRVIYIDDASTDETLESVKACVDKYGAGKRFTLIHNEKNRGAMYNLYTAIHSCAPYEIVVTLDGDDWIKHERVLSELNAYYADSNTWMTYGQYERYPDGQIGCCSPVRKGILSRGKVRDHRWRYSHIRSFYAGLFQRIRLEDFLYEGKFYQATYDLAMMFPMLEMARDHAKFIPDIFYVYNFANPLNDSVVRLKQQQMLDEHIRALPVYESLTEHPATLKESQGLAATESKNCDLIIFSYDRPMQLYALLESLDKRAKGFQDVFVIYRSHENYAPGYEYVKEFFPQVEYFEQSLDDKKAHAEFNRMVLDLTFGRKSAYVAYAVDDIIITDEFDVQDAIHQLEKVGAYAFYLRLAPYVDYCYTMNMEQGVPPLLEISEECFAWQFAQGKGDWNYPHSVDLTIYRKRDIEKDLRSFNFYNPNKMEGDWSKLADFKRIGLCYKQTKMINIPMNIVSTFCNRFTGVHSQEELNDLFNSGLKIDIDSVYQIQNHSCHIDIEPQFILR